MTLHGEPLTLTTFAANLDGVLISPTGEIYTEHDVFLHGRLLTAGTGPSRCDDDSLLWTHLGAHDPSLTAQSARRTSRLPLGARFAYDAPDASVVLAVSHRQNTLKVTRRGPSRARE